MSIAATAGATATPQTFQMNDYCITPAFLNLNVPTNLLLMFDNSASMYDLKYSTPPGTCSNNASQTCNSDGDCGTGTCNFLPGTCSNNNATRCSTDAQCGTGTCNNSFCYDNSYTNSYTYSGGFSSTTFYTSGGVPYGDPLNPATAGDVNPNNTTYSYFTPEAASSVPASCQYRATNGGSTYLCVNIDTTATPPAATIHATGNFLNWLTASKLDLQKGILTGGKYITKTCQISNKPCDTSTASTDCPGSGDTCVTAATPFLQSETRGCVGSRFIKEVPQGDWVTPLPTMTCPSDGKTIVTKGITFGVRGDISLDLRVPSSGGLSRIDLFQGAGNCSSSNTSGGFDNATCQKAVNIWTSGNGNGENATSSDTTGCLNVGGSTSTARATWNHALQSCWKCANTPCKPEDFSTGDKNAVTGDCEALDSGAMSSLMPSSPMYVCLRDTTANIYLGTCVTAFSSPHYAWDDTCVAQQLANYCNGVSIGEVVDPSSGSVATGGTGTAKGSGNIPANLMDGGVVNQLGNPLRTFHGRVATNTSIDGRTVPPTGLVQKYQKKIRMGAMKFNNYGSTSECSGTNPMIRYTCGATGNKDAGQIISFIGSTGYCSTNGTTCSTDGDCAGGVCNSAGDHTVGLINALDRITATTWTPFAEAYYNAIAYFVKDVNTSLGASYVPATSAPFAITAPLTGTDSYSNKNPVQYTCQINNIILISDGASTTDINPDMVTKVKDNTGVFRDPNTLAETGATSGTTNVCGGFSGSPYLHDLAYFAAHRNIFQPSQTCSPSTPCDVAQKISTYVVYTGTKTSTDPTSNATLSGVCDPLTEMTMTATNGGTSLYQAGDYQSLYTAIDQALAAMAGGEASSTAASILSNSSGSGANILQAVFFPQKLFGNDSNGNATKATWIGELQNLWYYVDPYASSGSTIREDNTYTSGTTHSLDLKTNYALGFTFDTNTNSPTHNQTIVHRYQDVNGTNPSLTSMTGVGSWDLPDTINAIWKAGASLLATSASSRNIYTPALSGGTSLSYTIGGTTYPSGLMSFSTANHSALLTYLQTGTTTDADKIITWVRGDEVSGYRSRTVAYSICSDTLRPCTSNSDCPSGTCGVLGTWKLGDIISSTPKVQSSVALNNYDISAPSGYGDGSYSTYVQDGTVAHYPQRGMAYVGANDGMLHAFKLGSLNVSNSGTQKATLTGTNVGKEMWTFIPTNALPYLRYLTCAAGGGDATYCNNQDYAHLYYIDGSTAIIDASIGKAGSCSSGKNYWQCDRDSSSWRTVLIGGMGLGGASKDNGDNCQDDASGTCVKSPLPGFGLSSYYALDITNEYFDASDNLAVGTPKFMWEFSDASITDSNDKGLGFTTTGAAIVKISSRDDTGTGLTGTNPLRGSNGRWFAVFGSGPTGPIDKASHQFMGTSSQNLKIYVVDLNKDPAAAWTKGTNYWVIDKLYDNSVIAKAFVSTMNGAPIDADRAKSSNSGNYQDDALYFGYVQKSGSGSSWNGGGILRLMTYENPDPSQWKLSKVIDVGEPVVTAVSRLQDRQNHQMWLYFGSGRYYYSQDDMATNRHLFGIKEPCYSLNDSLDPTCTTSVSFDTTSLTNQTTNSTYSGKLTNNGWFIELTAQAGSIGAERCITDPVALTNGAVFFSTFAPSSNLCDMGGSSYMWAVRYDSGTMAPAAALSGQALVQLSTGEFKPISLKDAFSGSRRSSAMTGKPPGDPPPVVSNSNLKPVKRIMHIQEY